MQGRPDAMPGTTGPPAGDGRDSGIVAYIIFFAEKGWTGKKNLTVYQEWKNRYTFMAATIFLI